MNEQTESVDERARRIVQQEVYLCLSSVVARLAVLASSNAA